MSRKGLIYHHFEILRGKGRHLARKMLQVDQMQKFEKKFKKFNKCLA